MRDSGAGPDAELKGLIVASTRIMGRTDTAGAAALRLIVAGALALMSIPLLSGPSVAAEFTSTGAIVIPGPQPPAGCPTFPPPNNSCPPTTADPYPASILIDGATDTITDVNLRLFDVTHASPADLDIMLQGPDGTNVLFMSDDCATGTDENPVSAIDLFFDDAAASAIPADAACTSGTFRPFDDEDTGEAGEFPFTGQDVFPSPAPAPSANTALSVFNGKTANGAWHLWVVDDNPDTPGIEGGRIGGGWSIEFNSPTDGTTTTTTTSTSTTSTTASTSTSTTSTTVAGATTTTSTTVAGATTTTVAAAAATTTTTSSSTAPILRLSSSSVPAGQRVTVAGDRLPANTGLQVNFLSAPLVLGNVTTNATGSFQSVFTIPADATAGAHQINVTNAAGTVLASVDLTVTRTTSVPGSLARTGLDTRRLGGVALLAVAMGVLILFSPEASRRRNHWKRRIARRRLSGALTWK